MDAAQVMTIEDIKQFAAERNMPLERMRFFIGEDYREPRAFGIFRNSDGEVVVYKNKEDGTRAIRYQGTDEVYAVSEIMKKLADEIQLRNHAMQPYNPAQYRPVQSPAVVRQKKKNTLIGVAIVVAVIAVLIIAAARTPNRGYYVYEGSSYYYLGGDWYYYDDYYNDWRYYSGSPSFSGNYSNYYVSDDSYNYSNYNTSNFYDTDYYYDYDYNSYNYDDNDSYNYYDSWDSWDSFDTNWGSDW